MAVSIADARLQLHAASGGSGNNFWRDRASDREVADEYHKLWGVWPDGYQSTPTPQHSVSLKAVLLGLLSGNRGTSPFPIGTSPVRIISRTDVRAMVRLFFLQSQWENAVMVAYCESGISGELDQFNANAWNRSGEDSRGLFQINVASGAHPQLAAYNLFDPITNVFWASEIYREADNSWQPWYNCARSLGLL